jgi:hypothetical protein
MFYATNNNRSLLARANTTSFRKTIQNDLLKFVAPTQLFIHGQWSNVENRRERRKNRMSWFLWRSIRHKAKLNLSSSQRTVHSTDATIANSTVMRIERFVGLTMTAHGMGRNSLFEQTRHRYGLLRDGTRVCKHGLDMRCQGHGTKGSICHGNVIGQMVVLCQECNGDHRIDNQYPDHRTHYCPYLIAMIDPNSILIARSKGAFPRLIVKGVLIIFRQRVRSWPSTAETIYTRTDSSADIPPIYFIIFAWWGCIALFLHRGMLK